MVRRRKRPRPEWITWEQGKQLQRLLGWLAVLFFATIFGIQSGLFTKIEDTNTALAIIGMVVAAVWLIPHIALTRIAWNYDGEIDFGPLGRHGGGAKQATLLLIFTVETILLPLALVLGWGRWY